MYRKLRIAVLSLVVFSVAVWAADDPLIGTWKLNLAKSKFSGSSPSKSDTMKYEPYGAGGMKQTREILTAEGKTLREEFSANYDGKDYPITGTPNVDTVSLKRIDSYTTVTTNKKAGKITTTIRSVVSRDGKTLTTTTTGTNATGAKINNVRVWDKQ